MTLKFWNFQGEGFKKLGETVLEVQTKSCYYCTNHLAMILLFMFFRGWQSLVAYGCQNFVVVLDPKTVQVC